MLKAAIVLSDGSNDVIAFSRQNNNKITTSNSRYCWNLARLQAIQNVRMFHIFDVSVTDNEEIVL